jgi:hypothetical protein
MSVQNLIPFSVEGCLRIIANSDICTEWKLKQRWRKLHDEIRLLTITGNYYDELVMKVDVQHMVKT